MPVPDCPSPARHDVPLLRIRGLTKSFGYRHALQAVDLVLDRAECVALRGPNGAGKSTLLRILASLSPADSGQILFQGLSLSHASPILRGQIGYLGHTPGLHNAFTLWQHLHQAAQLHDLIDPAPRMEALVHSAGMEDVLHMPMGELSRGMQQRGALCRLWLPDPRLVLLDEPAVHLDETGLAFLDELVSQRRTAQQAILFATHRQPLAARWADRNIWLAHGRLVPDAAGTES